MAPNTSKPAKAGSAVPLFFFVLVFCVWLRALPRLRPVLRPRPSSSFAVLPSPLALPFAGVFACSCHCCCRQVCVASCRGAFPFNLNIFGIIFCSYFLISFVAALFAAPHQAAPTVRLATDKGTPLPAEAPCFFFSSFFFFFFPPGHAIHPQLQANATSTQVIAEACSVATKNFVSFFLGFVSVFLVPFLPLPLLRSLPPFNLPLQRLRCLGYYIYFQFKNTCIGCFFSLLRFLSLYLLVFFFSRLGCSNHALCASEGLDSFSFCLVRRHPFLSGLPEEAGHDTRACRSACQARQISRGWRFRSVHA